MTLLRPVSSPPRPARLAPPWLWRTFTVWWLSLLLMVPLASAQNAESSAAASTTTEATEATDQASVASLLQLLEDPAAREQLIDQLRQVAAHDPTLAQASTDAEARLEAAEADSFPARVADGAQQFLQRLADDGQTAVEVVTSLGKIKEQQVWWAAWWGGLASLVIVIVATLLAYAVARALARRGYGFLDQRVKEQRQRFERERAAAAAASQATGVKTSARGGMTWFLLQWRRILAIFGAFVIDLITVVMAAAVGYGVSVVTASAFNGVSFLEPLFVNAFIATEVVKAIVRGVFATRFPGLRMFEMADDVALYWNRWFTWVIGLVGYGILAVVPMIQVMFTPAVGALISLVIMVVVYVYAVRVIWRNRQVLRDRLQHHASRATSSLFGMLIRVLSRSWHVLALAYFTVLLVASQVAPERALPFMIEATVQTMVAVGVAVFLSAFLTALLSRRIHLNEEWRARLPLLEARLNSYVPALLHGARLVILVVAALVVLDAWRVFNLAAWLASEAGRGTVSMILRVAIVLGLAAGAWVVLASVIEHRISALPGADGASARERTLLSLFRNAALIVILTLTILVVLSQIGINIGPLIAGAGVVGLAIGLGSQKLLQDIITGVFIQIENGMNQNDVVEVAGISGTVEKITVRSVGLRGLDGCLHIVPFSSIDRVSNYMRDFSYHLGHYTISYRESIEDAMHHLEAAFKEMMEDEVLAPEVLEDITIPGVTSLDDRGVTIRVLIKTTPGMQWAVQRGYNRLVKKHFNAAGIELAYPHTVLYFGQDKSGYAPPARVRATVADPGDLQTADQDLLARHGARVPGHTPTPLRPADKSRSADVLGNELDTVVDDEGERREPPHDTPDRPKA